MFEDLGVSDELDVEWIILSDRAEVVQNKLYALGAGWDRFGAAAFPVRHSFSVATSVLVPWNNTNEAHKLEIEMLDQDGKSVFKVEGQLEVGRAPGSKLGAPQRVQMAFNIDTEYKTPNTYVITAGLDGAQKRQIQYHVVPGPGVQVANAS